MKVKVKTLTAIVASLILAFAGGCNPNNSRKVPVLGPADPNGNREVIGYYNSSRFSYEFTISTYNQKNPDYDSHSQ